jgi:hypothetical protein
MTSCPIVIDWHLIHEGHKVIIKNIRKYLSTDESKVVKYAGLEVEIDIDEYKNEIVKVAKQVKDFFTRSKPRNLTGLDIECNREFWEEFNSLLLKYS